MLTGRKVVYVTEAGLYFKERFSDSEGKLATCYKKERKNGANHGLKLPTRMIYIIFIIIEKQRSIIMC